MTEMPSRHQVEKQARKDATRASVFRPDPQMERALQLRDNEPAYYDRLSPATKAALGYYLADKTAAATAPTGDAA